MTQNLTAEQKTKAFWEKYFVDRGVIAEQGAKFWSKQEHKYHWKSQFDYFAQADAWIEKAMPEERIYRQPLWQPQGRTDNERFMYAQACIGKEYDCPGTWTPEDQERIRACIRNRGQWPAY